MWLFYLQRRLKSPAARDRVANAIARFLPSGGAEPLDEEALALVEDLRTQGYHVLKPPLSADDLAEVRAYLEQRECSDPYRPGLGHFTIDRHPPETHVAYYGAEDVVRCPHVFDLANSEVVLSGLARLFGCKPTIAYMTAWWSIAGHDRGEQAELFHRDVDDWRFIKLFLYATDVDEDAGPHGYVPGSHRAAKLLRIKRFTEEEVRATFGQDSVMRFTGPAGTCFLENTFGIHRGYPPARRNRLIVQIVYSLLPTVPGAPETPLLDTLSVRRNALLDPYINRVYLKAN